MASKKGDYSAIFPDMKLWQEIIFLKKFSVCPFVIENVIPYYEPLIKNDFALERHLFWCNFSFAVVDLEKVNRINSKIGNNDTLYGYNISGRLVKTVGKNQILRNLVNPEIGLAILDQVRGIKRKSKLKQISILDAADGA